MEIIIGRPKEASVVISILSGVVVLCIREHAPLRLGSSRKSVTHLDPMYRDCALHRTYLDVAYVCV